ncbi:MAG: MBL fold metallo-hydrolase [Rhodoferax sp.]|nr:MBL fold metallo-hydrolase [Rhodoferax sp.]
MIRSRFLWLSIRMLAVSLVLAACSATYEGSISNHFDGKVFRNPGQVKNSSVAGYLWLRLTTSQAQWPESVAAEIAPTLPARVNGSEARVTWVGHATVLIQVAGLNILTDPVWAERASPITFVGPKRVTAPAISLHALPPIDVVLISHDHYDHLDTATLRRLDTAHKPRVIVPLGNRALVQKTMPASTVTEHDWGEVITFANAAGSATFHVEPMLHGSGRTPFDQMETLWAAFVIEANGIKMYHVGDTGYGDGDNFRAAGLKHGGFDLAIFPIGAYEPASFMADSHMRPSQAVQAMVDANARQALAHHFETFQLGFEAFDAPRNEVKQTLVERSLPSYQFAVLRPGQSLKVLATARSNQSLAPASHR